MDLVLSLNSWSCYDRNAAGAVQGIISATMQPEQSIALHNRRHKWRLSHHDVTERFDIRGNSTFVFKNSGIYLYAMQSACRKSALPSTTKPGPDRQRDASRRLDSNTYPIKGRPQHLGHHASQSGCRNLHEYWIWCFVLHNACFGNCSG